MANSPSPEPSDLRTPRQFATTQWSVVLRAGTGDSADADAALSRLCRVYWYPLYAHVRRRGVSAADAQDLTQEFFAQIIRRRVLSFADPQRGRFRTFILTALDHFLRDEWQKARAQKRGGGDTLLPLDFTDAEQRFAADNAVLPPDRAFDRQWAVSLLESVLGQLAQEYQRDGKGALFVALRPTITAGANADSYAEIGARLGVSEGALKVAAHRLKQRYRARLRAEVEQTVATSGEVDEEMQHLLRAFAGV